MLRVEVKEGDHEPLPPVDLDDASFVIGSAPDARVRLPGIAAQPEHVRVENGKWRDLVSGDDGTIGEGVTIELGTFKVKICPAPERAVAAPPQRTESLARELLRGLLGDGAAPSLEIERGPHVGATRRLAPPESTLVIGRGDEANWILVDEDLSRTHAEIRRGWDGTRIVDLFSKNGSRVDGVVVGAGGTPLRDGQLIELGKVAFRFRDPADRHFGVKAPSATVVATPAARMRTATAEQKSEPQPAPAPPSPEPVAREPAARPSRAPFYIAVTIMLAALAGLVWVLAV